MNRTIVIMPVTGGTGLILLLAIFGLGGTGSSVQGAVGLEAAKAVEEAPAKPAAVAAAFAALLGQCDLAQPLFVRTHGQAGSLQVELFSIPEQEFAHSLEAITSHDRRVASVSLTPTTLIISLAAQSAPATRAREGDSDGSAGMTSARAAASAVAYLHSLGYLHPEFRIRVVGQSAQEYRVEVVAFPMTPGGHKTIFVSKTQLRMIPGA